MMHGEDCAVMRATGSATANPADCTCEPLPDDARLCEEKTVDDKPCKQPAAIEREYGLAYRGWRIADRRYLCGQCAHGEAYYYGVLHTQDRYLDSVYGKIEEARKLIADQVDRAIDKALGDLAGGNTPWDELWALIEEVAMKLAKAFGYHSYAVEDLEKWFSDNVPETDPGPLDPPPHPGESVGPHAGGR